MNLTVVLGLGLLLGMQHATEPDHLAAVAALAGRERSLKQGIFHGVAWGLGHTLMLLLVAGAVGFLGWVISPAIAGHLEQLVGAMLILLGANVVRRLWRERLHFHAHKHPAETFHFQPHTQDASVLQDHSHAHTHPTEVMHFHAHSHLGESQPHAQSPHSHSHRLPLRSLLVGMVHGLAGSAALALLASQSMPSPAWMLVYIAVFGTGSMLGMALLSGVLAVPLGMTAKHLTRVYRVLNVGVAIFSIGLGTKLLLVLGG
ncbi:high frequency lysogenization protein HflD [Pseudolysobacter antarcticus]|uniref:high frequency lysogenization protein HflD n=1 Tax=Pseudolysobacter antarcticus TaxID=2511995 RepID=UPI001A9109F9|nr:high frequency lysogenization protein HflD [Pseudolysobacter antarcticus]